MTNQITTENSIEPRIYQAKQHFVNVPATYTNHAQNPCHQGTFRQLIVGMQNFLLLVCQTPPPFSYHINNSNKHWNKTNQFH